ncbi:MAG: fibronectin type III domain-containing protein [Clostridia bacterium]|nr:fibronectin type III domain-containing protein [Clostridia bacterium]
MNNYLKKLLSMLMVLSVVFALFIPAFAADDGVNEIVMDKAYSDSISADNREDSFKFTTTEYGRVRFYFTTSMRPFTIVICNAKGEEVKKFVTTRSTSGDVVYSHTLDAGTYFLKVNGKGTTGLIDMSTGSYEFRMTFTAETKGQTETDADKNNDLKYAKEIKADSTTSGKILNDDENDFYKFIINTSGSVALKFTSKMQYYSIYLLNANGDSIWSSESNQWDASKKQRVDTYKFELSAGTYYIKVNGIGSTGTLIKIPVKTKGNYSFNLDYKSSGQTSAEPNNSIVNPNKIALDKKIVGHLSMTDGKDFYEINVSKKSDVMIGFVSYMPSYNIRVLDADNKEVWSSKNNALAEKATSRKDVHEFSLAAGKYFIVIDGGMGKYDFLISNEVSVSKVKTVNYERTVTTLRLYWSKVSGADGYEVFKYDEAKKEFVKIGSTTSKRSLKLKKLKGGTTYEFKVRAYKKLNGCIVYGDFSEERTATTTPAKATISSVKAGVKSATVNWKTVNGATGYRVFYTTDKDFDYVSKKVVKDGKATSKTIKKLKSGKKYYFKVRAYKTFKGKNIYGALSKVKSVKVK